MVLKEKLLVLLGYVQIFKAAKDQKGKGPLEIEIFFVEGGLRKGLEGGQEFSKTFHSLFIQQENKFLKSVHNNREVPSFFPFLNFATGRLFYIKHIIQYFITFRRKIVKHL